MESPQISRSGRVLKKTAKVKEMEDFDINELERPKKRGLSDDSEEELSPLKIPKISLHLPPHKRGPLHSPLKQKGDVKRFLPRDSPSPDGSKESDSSSASSETSSSSATSSDDSDGEVMPQQQQQRFSAALKRSQQEKVIVEPYRQFNSSVSYADDMDESEEETSDSGLIIAEESNDSFMGRGPKGGGRKRQPKKDVTFQPKRGGGAKKRVTNRGGGAAAAAMKKEKGVGKPLTAYMLWCTENRKKIAASGLGIGNIGKKMGEAWQSLPDKEKMAWRRKAKKLAMKNAGGLISTGPVATVLPRTVSRSTSSSEDTLRHLVEGSRQLGTAAIDTAAYLKLLGDALSTIGQRLTEHEGQLAVSGIFSVLLDTILCVIGPMLCLTYDSPDLNCMEMRRVRNTLDSIAYFMPGL